MKRILLTYLIFILFFSYISECQNDILKYHKIKIILSEKFTFNDALRMGIDMESATIKPECFIETYANDYELKMLKDNNINYEIMINDLSKFYIERANKYSNDKVEQVFSNNFAYGSMMGQYTVDEAYSQYNLMRSIYPQYVKKSISIGKTYEGREIKAYYFGDTSNSQTPKVLFTHLHHAREGSALISTTYFLWNLMERAAGGDVNAQYLFEKRGFWVIPIVNPDGVAYNQLTNPEGGGVWRKNRYPTIKDSIYGIDLNRNYGPEEYWNSPNNGSSTITTNETYRGSQPFSELEVKAIELFCNDNQVKIAVNYHTFGNLLIYPYSAVDKQTPDSNFFYGFSRELTKTPLSSIGRDNETVGYATRGGSDDWMYEPNDLKEKIFSFSPELGPKENGFWPLKDSLLPIARKYLKLNEEVLWSGDYNIRPVDAYLNYDSLTKVSKIIVRVQNVGVSKSPEIMVKLNCLSPQIKVYENIRTLAELKSAEEDTLEFKIYLDTTLQTINGQYYQYEFSTMFDNITRRDTFNIKSIVYTRTPIFTDGKLFGQWSMGNWGFEYDASLGKDVMTDSPYGYYQNWVKNYMTMTTPMLINALGAELVFNSTWNFEGFTDYGVVQISTDNGANWNSLITSRMVHFLDPDSDVTYRDGFSTNYPMWTFQRCSLDDYIGKEFKLRLGVITDYGAVYNGWKIDDLKILIYPEMKGMAVEENFSNDNIIVYPNPLGEKRILNIATNSNISKITVINTLGIVVYENNFVQFNSNFVAINLQELPKGIYFIELYENSKIYRRKIIIN